jgi:hypothetical protein
MSRKYTNMLLEMAEEGGALDSYVLIRDLLNYLSEAEVQDFAEQYGYIEEEEEEDEDS